VVTLLDLLREQLHLAGTKKGCDHGQCGACTVLVDGRRKSACLLLAVSLDGVEVTTVEGLGNDGALHPLQQACIDRDAFQCGYCTPGQICSAVVHVEGPAGSRTIAFADFHRLPDETPHLDSTLAQGELVTAVELPAGKGGQHHTVKLRDRLSYAFALIASRVGTPNLPSRSCLLERNLRFLAGYVTARYRQHGQTSRPSLRSVDGRTLRRSPHFLGNRASDRRTW
jgi:hypothetical protein